MGDFTMGTMKVFAARPEKVTVTLTGYDPVTLTLQNPGNDAYPTYSTGDDKQFQFLKADPEHWLLSFKTKEGKNHELWVLEAALKETCGENTPALGPDYRKSDFRVTITKGKKRLLASAVESDTAAQHRVLKELRGN